MAKETFSESKLKQLAAAARAYRVFDARVEGLGLRVSPTGKKVFIFKRWVAGETVEGKLGSFDLGAISSAEFQQDPLAAVMKDARLNLEMARDISRAINAKLATGENPFKIRERYAPKNLTVAELFDIYVRDHLEGKRKRVEETKAEFNRDCMSRFGKLELSEIDGGAARAWHKQLTAKKGPYTANRRVQLMRAIYNKAIKWRIHSGGNPFAEVELNPEKERQHTITEQQMADLWNELEATGNSLIRDWGRLLLLTGARKTELCQMRWDCLDLENQRWFIPDSKNGESRTVALGDLEIEILRQRAERGICAPWVFPSKNGSALKDPKNSWDTIRRAAGVPEFTIHDARRQLGTMLARAGADLKVMQKALGHKDIKTTMKHYRVANEDDQREAKNAASSGFLSIAKATKPKTGERVE